MIIKEFTPTISDHSIQQALDTPTGDEYPENVRQAINKEERANQRENRYLTIAIIVIVLLSGSGLVLSFILPGFLVNARLLLGLVCLIGAGILYAINRKPKVEAQQSLDQAAKFFYHHLFGVSWHKSMYTSSYWLLAPKTMEKISQDEFIEIWKKVRDEIILKVKFQDSTSCDVCNKTSQGLWYPVKIGLEDEIANAAKLFFECPECKKVLCIECFNNLPKNHPCPFCGKKLHNVSEGCSVFMQESDVKFSPAWTPNTDLHTSYINDRLADIVCEMTFDTTYRRIHKGATLYGVDATKDYLEFGEKGRVIYRFRNKAVKIGDNWRFLSADPSR